MAHDIFGKYMPLGQLSLYVIFFGWMVCAMPSKHIYAHEYMPLCLHIITILPELFYKLIP